MPGRVKRKQAEVALPLAKRIRRERPLINEIPKLPTQRLNVYVFGSGTICELGLGPNVVQVKRPRLNPLLPIDQVGVVSMAVGGSHVICIDYNGKLWSWGQNDSGVLGRETTESQEIIDEDNDLNSKESTPALVEGIPENVRFVSVAATDNCSAAISEDGKLWAWGTFVFDGEKVFKSRVECQRTPIHISQFKGVVQIAGGKDHLIVLDKFGEVYSWGIGQSYQLGHEVNSRLRTKTFGPSKIVGLKNIKFVACGEYHSFAIDTDNKLWAWGLNNFGQCGITDNVGEGATVKTPTRVTFFEHLGIIQVDGGNHHSLMLTKDGDIYAVGEMNFHQLGIPNEQLPKSTVFEQDGVTPSYVPVPTKLTTGPGGIKLPKFKQISTGVDHSLALSAEDGSAWTWGFGAVYQLGHGKPEGEDDPEDEPVPTKIENTASRCVNMVFCGAGGQFSILAGVPRQQDGI